MTTATWTIPVTCHTIREDITEPEKYKKHPLQKWGGLFLCRFVLLIVQLPPVASEDHSNLLGLLHRELAASCFIPADGDVCYAQGFRQIGLCDLTLFSDPLEVVQLCVVRLCVAHCPSFPAYGRYYTDSAKKKQEKYQKLY